MPGGFIGVNGRALEMQFPACSPRYGAKRLGARAEDIISFCAREGGGLLY